jgi:hypothetical protein
MIFNLYSRHQFLVLERWEFVSSYLFAIVIFKSNPFSLNFEHLPAFTAILVGDINIDGLFQV